MQSNSHSPRWGGWILVVALLGAAASTAWAQEQPEPAGGALPPYAQRIEASDGLSPALRVDPVNNGLRNIVLTGYWPPTNEMLRQFSPNPAQNPGGWVGENWEGRGYNVYAFFPEFPNGLGKGEGDYEVDYQDTSNDFWPLMDLLQPIALVSYGRAGNDHDWELEGGNRMYSPSSWSNDYLSPYDPTPELPIYYEPVGNERMSTLPLQPIVDAINAQVPSLYPYSTTIDTSRFLCNYAGYHANWYHELHADPTAPDWNVTAGFIHLGYAMTIADATAGAEVTLRVVIDHVDATVLDRYDFDDDGDVDADDYAALAGCLAGPGLGYPLPCAEMDLDGSGDVDMVDYVSFTQAFTGS